MSRTLLVSLAGILLLASLASAHLTNPDGSWSSGVLTNGGSCRYGGSPSDNGGTCAGWLNSGVSGTYVGPAGASVRSDLLPLTVDLEAWTPCSADCTLASALCDLEQWGSGTHPSPDEALNEEVVDNSPSGVAPDGTWDDGGIGGACHTNHYPHDDAGCTVDDDPYPPACPSFNTYGCHGTAHAKDALSEHHVWIMPTCDYLTHIRWDPCLISVIPPIGKELVECLTDTLFCSHPDPDCFLISCGGDGSADVVALGAGGGDFNDASSAQTTGAVGSSNRGTPGGGVPYPPIDRPECAPEAVAATFVLQGVEANVGGVVAENATAHGQGVVAFPNGGRDAQHRLTGALEALAPFLPSGAARDTYLDALTRAPNVQYTLATAGWIDWTPLDRTSAEPDGKGAAINLPAEDPPECSDFEDNDDDGSTDGDDEDCYAVISDDPPVILSVYNPLDDDEST